MSEKFNSIHALLHTNRNFHQYIQPGGGHSKLNDERTRGMAFYTGRKMKQTRMSRGLASLWRHAKVFQENIDESETEGQLRTQEHVFYSSSV